MKSDWMKILLDEKRAISDALQILEEQSQRIVLILDSNQLLIGTVTDGDIRRAIMNHKSLDTPVSEIMNTAPVTVQVGTPKALVKKIMLHKDLRQIPVLREGKVQDVITLKELEKKSTIENPVILMAGGFGKRLGDLTQSCPKPMLKVGEKPIMETILENFINAGFYNFYISLHYMSDVIKAHFGDGEKWGVNIQYIEENEPLGTAGGLGLLPDLPSDLPAIVMNCDLLTKLDLSNLLEFHSEANAYITVCVRKHEYQVPYGVIETDGEQLLGIAEKPIHDYFVNAGIYVIEQSVLSNINGEQYLDMPDLVNQLLQKSHEIQVFPIHEYWLDIGKYEDFSQAQSDYIKKFRYC